MVEKGKRTSQIRITPFEVDEAVANSTETFEHALKEGDLRSICESRATSAVSDEEKADWKVIEALISENPRKSLVDYLGFQNQADEAANGLAKLDLDKEAKEEEVNGEPEKKQPRGPGAKKHKRLQSMFDASAEADNFLSDLSASKGARTNDPFQILTGSETEAERRITRALLLGEFEKALDVALQEDRMSDAFMIAICGGEKCIEKAREFYFSKHTDGPNYMRLLASIAGKNLWDIVHNADLSNWREAMATLCTFADEKEFSDLCEALGDRIEEQVRSTGDKSARKDASFCYLAGSKLEKVVAIWIEELAENEQKGIETAADNSIFSIHVRALQGLIEKVTIFRQVTNFQDVERTKGSDWKLSVLYDKYIEYADVVATHGRLQVAQKYLDLVPEKHPEAEVARNRIKLAMRQATPQKPQTAAVPTARAASTKPLPASGYQPQPTFATSGPVPTVQTPYAPPTAATPPPGNIYAPPAATTATTAPSINPYAPPTAAVSQPTNPYASIANSGYTPAGYQPPQAMRAPGVTPAPFGTPPMGGTVPPPPRASTRSPASVTTYTTATNLPAWNDLPEGFAKPPMARRATPAAAAAPISSPFPTQGATTQGPPPPGPPPAGGQRTPSVPPPPKGTAPPPRMTSPSVSRPESLSGPPPPPNPYASLPQSPQTVPGMGVPPSIPRGPSPYSAPPSAPPPSNRYAPSPAAQPAIPSFQPRGPVPPPPQAAASPYASQQAQQSPIASHPVPSTPPSVHQTLPPPQGSRPSTAQSQRKAAPLPAPAKYRKLNLYNNSHTRC